MKRLLLIALLALSISAFAQKPMDEKSALKESHIDFTKQYLFFVIIGNIEIDGHEFVNQNQKCPIIYKADIKSVTISDTCTNTYYRSRQCERKDCRVIHLEQLTPTGTIATPMLWRNTYGL